MIPVDVDDLTPEWLGHAMGRDVRAVEVLERHSGTTGRARLAVRYGASAADGPDTVFVKLAPFDPAQREFVARTGLGIAEARFYAELARDVPVRVPEVHCSEWSPDGAFVMVLEDLRASGCRFPRPRDDDIGDTIGRIVEELATLHARYWCDPRLGAELAWVTEGARVRFGQRSSYIAAALEQFGEELGAAFRRVGELYLAHPTEIATVLRSGAPTLVHGDAHLGNLFVDVAGGNRPGFLDWAMVWRAGGVRDVAYVLGNSVPTEVRRAGEREWIRGYVSALGRHGIELDEADAWDQYRVLVVYAWASATATAAMGARWQPERIGHGGMRRATATIEDLDSATALEVALAPLLT